MKIETTSIRLKQIMQEKGLRQVDLIEMLKPFCNKYNVKINKSDISQYLSGKVKPGQEKLAILGMALNVSESWLMGLDVSQERTDATTNSLTINEKTLLSNYSKLNMLGKNKLIDYSNDLVDTPKYINNDRHNNDLEETPNCVSDDDLEIELFAAHNDGIDEETNKRNMEKIKALYAKMHKK